MAQSQKVIVSSERKIQDLYPNNYRSLTELKNKKDAPLLNAQLLTASINKKCNSVSITPDSFKENIFSLLEEMNSRGAQALADHLRDWMQDRWSTLKMNLSSRFNKLHYLCPSLCNESFGEIEKEILLEWKKNSFLQGFQLLCNYTFTSLRFSSVKEVQQFYNQLRTIISQLVFMIFEPSLRHLVDNKFPLEDKLYNYTSITILTSSKQWPAIAEKVIKPQFLNQCPSFSENYDLEDLNASPQLIDPEANQVLFKNTAAAIRQLDYAYSPAVIVNNLKFYRENLVSEIQVNINNWRKKHPEAKQMILEKQDILACIIYSLVTHKLDNIALTLKYLSFLYQGQLEAVLGSFQVDVYRVDIQVAYQYIMQPVLHLSIDDLVKVDSESTIASP